MPLAAVSANLFHWLIATSDSGTGTEQLPALTILTTDTAVSESTETLLIAGHVIVIVDDHALGSESASILLRVTDSGSDTETTTPTVSTTDSAAGSEVAAVQQNVVDSAIAFDFVSSPSNSFIIRSLKPRFVGPSLKWAFFLARSRRVTAEIPAHWLVSSPSSKWRFLMGADELEESAPKEFETSIDGVLTKWLMAPPRTIWMMELSDGRR